MSYVSLYNVINDTISSKGFQNSIQVNNLINNYCNGMNYVNLIQIDNYYYNKQAVESMVKSNIDNVSQGASVDFVLKMVSAQYDGYGHISVSDMKQGYYVSSYSSSAMTGSAIQNITTSGSTIFNYKVLKNIYILNYAAFNTTYEVGDGYAYIVARYIDGNGTERAVSNGIRMYKDYTFKLYAYASTDSYISSAHTNIPGKISFNYVCL